MSTTITDVTELQAMEDDLTEDYVLGNNIDASATSGWNGGEGFAPVGAGLNQVSNSRPESDDFGYAGQSGSWTIYPSDGVYYDKVDEETHDSDTTYIQADTHGSYCLLAYDATALDIPDDATNITVVIRSYVRNKSSGTSYVQGMLNINGTEYLVGSNLAISSQSYALKQWTMTTDPSTSSAWTVAGVFALAVAGVGVKVSDALPNLRITQLYIRVRYDVKFAGTFDGAGYTISDLYINRPTERYTGLFGYTDAATIHNVRLTGANISGDDATAGLVGWSVGDTIYNCSTSGTITGSDDYVGGITGVLAGSAVSKCHSSANISGDAFIGGLLGYVGGSSSILDCYARGSVTGDSYVGGLIGYTDDTVDNSYSAGAVTGNSNDGGLIGYNGGTVTDSFWDTETSGQATSDGGTGKTTAEMKTLATFTSWNIGGSAVNRNDGYPFLHWESGGAVPIWQIWQDPDVIGKRSWTIPDLKDPKGRVVKNARVRAFRVDTHALVETEITDANGSATFTDLPNDVDVAFHATWGG